MQPSIYIGKLFLVPAPLDFMCSTQVPLHQVMPQTTLEIASQIDHWVCENAKSARALLKRIGDTHPLKSPLQAQQITELPRQVHKKGDRAAGVDTSGLLAAQAISAASIRRRGDSTPSKMQAMDLQAGSSAR